MSSLENKKIKDTYKDLLQVSNENNGIDDTLRIISDGEGTESSLKLSSTNASFSGNVGIGTDSPATALDINKELGESSPIITLSRGGVAKSRFAIANATDSILVGSLTDDLCLRTEGENIRFGTASATKTDMSILSNGNVGIGTTSPGGKLHIHQDAADGYANSIFTTSNSSFSMGVGGSEAQLPELVNKFYIYDNVNAPVGPRFIINSAGNVGIGTTNPETFDSEANQLVVRNTGHAGITICAGSPDHRSNLYFADGVIQNAKFRGGITYDHSDDKMVFRIAATEHMWIANNGNIGIGDSTPAQKLSVAGNVHISGDLTVDGDGTEIVTETLKVQDKTIVIADTTSPTEDTSHEAGIVVKGSPNKSFLYNKENSSWNSSNDIIINGDKVATQSWVSNNAYDSLTDVQKAELKGDQGEAGADGANGDQGDAGVDGKSAYEIYAEDTSPALSEVDWLASLQGAVGADGAKGDQGDAYFTQNGNDISYSGGNVGIGTTEPSAKLHVTAEHSDSSPGIDNLLVLESFEKTGQNLEPNDGLGILFKIPVENATSAVGARIAAVKEGGTETATSTELVFEVSQQDETLDEAMRIDRDGNVGIGTTSPDDELHIYGDGPAFQVEDNSGPVAKVYAGDNEVQFGSWSNHPVRFNVGASEKMRILSNGNVGIGDSNPSKKLSVSGDAIITGDLTITGTTVSVDTTNLEVENKNIIMGNSNSPDDDTANGGGIILKGATDKSILYNKQTNSWNSSLPITINSAPLATQSWVSNNVYDSLTDAQKAELKGDQGDAGVDGANGDQGDAGVDGKSAYEIYSEANPENTLSEEDWLVSLQGADGAKGDQGDAGADGTNGAVGEKGDQGDAYFTQNGNNISYTNGNIGIGTTNPANGKIEVFGAASDSNQTEYVDLAITQDANLTASKVKLRSGVTSGTDPYFAILTRNNNGIDNDPGVIKERMRIDSNGNVGIGDSNPSKKLSVDGDAIITGDLTINGTTVSVNTTNLEVENKNIIMGNAVDPGTLSSIADDDTANGGGIVLKGATDKSILYNKETSSWNSSLPITINSAPLATQSWVSNNVYDSLTDAQKAELKGDQGDAYFTQNGNDISYSDGNVGIGTTNPDASDWNANSKLLHIHQNDTNGAMLRLESSNTAFVLSSADNKCYLGTIGAQPLEFYTDSAARMIISSGGNVGIGTASPSASLEVHSGNTNTVAQFVSTDAGANIAFKDNTTSTDNGLGTTAIGATSDNLIMYTNNGEKMRITSAGKVGIGTTSPDATLEVQQISNAPSINIKGQSNSTASTIIDRATLGFNYGENSGFIIGSGYTSNSTDFYIHSVYDYATRLMIDANGNVGIGTTSPYSKLDVHGIIEAGDTLATSGSVALRIRYTGSSNDYLNNFGSMYSSGASLIGFGVRSSTTESLKFLSTADNSNFSRGALIVHDELEYLSAPPQSTATGEEVNLTSRFKILENGNVGIGTDNPEYKLDIQGDGSAIRLGSADNPDMVFLGRRGSSGANLDKGYLRLRDDSDVSAEKNKVVLDTAGNSWFNGGNVGIGTTSPSENLCVQNANHGGSIGIGSDSGESEYQYINFANNWQLGKKDSNSNSIAEPGAFYLFNIDASLPNQGRTDFTVLTNGNVGIGTTNPEAILDVARLDQNETQPALKVSRGDTSAEYRPTTPIFNVFNGQAGGTEVFRVQGNGNVGIGTSSPQSKLHILRSGTISGVQSERALILDSEPGNYKNYAGISFRVAGTEKGSILQESTGRLYISSNHDNSNPDGHLILQSTAGNVGIGTASPGSYKLNVQGSVYALNGVTGSDDRIKHNEQPIKNALDTLSKITPKKYIKTAKMYEANHDFALNAENKPIDENKKEVEHTIEAGVIAQELKKIDELAFAVNDEQKDEDGNVIGPHAVNYNSLFTYAISAINELNQKVGKLESDLVISRFKLAELEYNQRNSK